MRNVIYKLFACCIPVKGHTRSIICDLQRIEYDFIPNALYEILTKHENQSIDQIKNQYDSEHWETIDEYFQFLINKEYVFECAETDVEKFPPIQLNWQSPSRITNVIIDLDTHTDIDFNNLVDQLNFLGCDALQIRCFKKVNLAFLNKVLIHFSISRLRHIDIYVKYDEATDYSQLLLDHPRISFITIHSSPYTKTDKSCIYYIIDEIATSAHCGIINPDFFYPHIKMFTEAFNFNSCLNAKISIDEDGNIKNCPAMQTNYGNIKNTSLSSVVSDSSFRELWNITKDKIMICQDCEFRYICTDCRAFIEDQNDILSKPAKCKYDPYTATWL